MGTRDLGSWRGVKAAPCRLDGPGLGGEGSQTLESGHTQKNPKVFLLHPGGGGAGWRLSAELVLPQGLSHRTLPVPGHLLEQLERLAPNTCPLAAPLAAAPCCPFRLPLCSGRPGWRAMGPILVVGGVLG